MGNCLGNDHDSVHSPQVKPLTGDHPPPTSVKQSNYTTATTTNNSNVSDTKQSTTHSTSSRAQPVVPQQVSPQQQHHQLQQNSNHQHQNGATIQPIAAAPAPVEDDLEWKETIRVVFLLMLDRLAQMLELENETLAELAATIRKLPNPHKANGARAIDILSTNTLNDIESFFTTVFDFDPASFSALPCDVHSLSYPQLQLQRWIIAAQNSSFKAPVITNLQLAKKVSAICHALRTELLLASSKAESKQLSTSLEFFAHSFEFATRTDIVNQPQTLYANIDAVCNNSEHTTG